MRNNLDYCFGLSNPPRYFNRVDSFDGFDIKRLASPWQNTNLIASGPFITVNYERNVGMSIGDSNMSAITAQIAFTRIYLM